MPSLHSQSLILREQDQPFLMGLVFKTFRLWIIATRLCLRYYLQELIHHLWSKNRILLPISRRSLIG